MFIVIANNDGIETYGPFKTFAGATDWAESFFDPGFDDWWVDNINAPPEA